MLPSTRGDRSNAARLLAAAEALRSRIGVPVQLPDRPDVDAVRLEVKRELTDEAFRVAWEAGQSVAIAAMVDEVLPGRPASEVTPLSQRRALAL